MIKIPKTQDRLMPLTEHFMDLRQSILRSLIGTMLIFFCLWYASESLLLGIKRPLSWADPHQQLHILGPLDFFWSQMKVSFLGAMIFAIPLWFYELKTFLKPALEPKENFFLNCFMAGSFILFLFGLCLGFGFVLPLALRYLLTLSEVGVPLLSLNDYVSFVISLTLGFGFVFQVPMGIFLLSRMGLIKKSWLSGHRKIVFILSLILGALLTPPDIFTQLALSIPLYLMFELSLLFLS